LLISVVNWEEVIKFYRYVLLKFICRQLVKKLILFCCCFLKYCMEYSILRVVSYCVYTPNTTFAVMVISNCWMRTFFKQCEGSAGVCTYSIEMWKNYTCRQSYLLETSNICYSVYIFQIRIVIIPLRYNFLSLSCLPPYTGMQQRSIIVKKQYLIWTPDKSIFKYSVVCVGWANNILQTRSRQQIGFTILSEFQCICEFGYTLVLSFNEVYAWTLQKMLILNQCFKYPYRKIVFVLHFSFGNSQVSRNMLIYYSLQQFWNKNIYNWEWCVNSECTKNLWFRTY
jgi:hypothetical protein